MKRLLILVAGLLMVEESFALPKCPPWRIFSNLAVVACTYTWANGNKYVGEFKDGKRHGQGIYTLPEWGTKFIGEFKADKRWEGIRYHASGRIWGTYSNGERCKGCKPTARQLAIVREIDPSQIATTTASSKQKVWCATKDATWSSVKGCRSGVKAFQTEYQAQAEHQRLKKQSTSVAASVAHEESDDDWIWCATKNRVSGPTQRRVCRDALQGKVFDTKYQAQAEHQRLKGTATTSTSGSKSVWWCANKYFSWRASKHSDCGFAKVFSSKYQAEAEHKRLKATSTPVIKTASLTVRSNVKDDKVYIDGNFKGSTRLDLDLPKGKHSIRIEKDGYEAYEETINLTDNLIIRGHLEKVVEQPAQTTAVQTAAKDETSDSNFERDFWQSIKDSNDPDEYQAYLDEFPTGKFSKLTKLRIKKLGGSTTLVAKSSIPDINYGSYHALVIGNNDYKYLPKLRMAVNDADAVASVLKNKYGFNVKLLKNANRSQMLGSLAAFRKVVNEEDNFLLYYAGHGYLDEVVNEGYWLPVDAEREDPTNWLQNDTIVAQVKGMQAKHVMVVADSCFSGTMTRGLKLEQRTPGWLEKMVKKKARTALTSGGLEPVMDSGGGSHSVFAEAFIRLLEENGEVLDASQLFSQLRPKVMVNSTQTPEYGNIHLAGHDGGDFLFVRR